MGTMYQFPLLTGVSMRGFDHQYALQDYLKVVGAPLWRLLLLKKLLMRCTDIDQLNLHDAENLATNSSFTSSTPDMSRSSAKWSEKLRKEIGIFAQEILPLMAWESHLAHATPTPVSSVPELLENLLEINRRIDELTLEFEARKHTNPEIPRLLELNASETHIRTHIADLLQRYIDGDRDMRQRVFTYSDNREEHEHKNTEDYWWKIVNPHH